MQNSPYIIAWLLMLLWAIVTFGPHSFGAIDILLPIAALLVLLRILFSEKNKNYKNEKI